MSRICEIMGTKPKSGNNVSHSQRKTKRVFDINLVNVTYDSKITNKTYKFRVTAKTKRSIDKYGDLDCFMQNVKTAKLTNQARKIQKEIRKISVNK